MENPNPIIFETRDCKNEQAYHQEDLQHTRNLLSISDWKRILYRGFEGMCEEDLKDLSFHKVYQPLNEEEVFQLIRGIMDPEHPLTLEQLGVVFIEGIKVDHTTKTVSVEFTPTIPHCSQATMIGLMLRVKLNRCLSPLFKINIRVTPGTHYTEEAINKQLNDKERVAAALENITVLNMIQRGIDETSFSNVWSYV